MVVDVETFLGCVDRQIQAKHLLTHEFYQAWSRGQLTIECLREYAKEYYHHIVAFPTYLSAIHACTDDLAMRLVLLRNLMAEETGSPNHLELWRNFALALGVKSDELDQHTPNAEIKQVVNVFRELCGPAGTATGVAALYAYESQIPEICISKIEGLKKHYGMKDPSGWEYFHVHIEADQEHAAEERALLGSLVRSDNSALLFSAVDRVLDILWNFLSGLCGRFGVRVCC